MNSMNSMLTRIYKYKIRPGTENEYLKLQEDVLAHYRVHAEVDALFLHDSKDPTMRTEVIRFFGSNPGADIQRIDSDPNILKLFSLFQSEILDPNKKEIHEETLTSERLSSAGKPHHIELYCSNLTKTEEFWSWFLGILGYKQFQKWNGGVSFKLADTYIVFVQAEEKYLSAPFHRCCPGLNHLAFHAASAKQVDEVTAKLRERGIRILYEDKHPHAGGPESYAVFFEDPERIKVELAVPSKRKSQ